MIDQSASRDGAGHLTDESFNRAGSKGVGKALLEFVRDQLPIRRKRYRKLKEYTSARLARIDAQLAEICARLDAVSACLLALPDLATNAALATIVPLDLEAATEICLFVSHAPELAIKPHVREHIRALVNQGISVVLVINSPHPPQQFRLDSEFVMLLSGCMVRANRGFDFAAWAHAYSQLQLRGNCKRLYLVNDSIVGPLNNDTFAHMITQIRASTVDLLGLTENCLPRPHLQSYFLIVNGPLLHSGIFRQLMCGIVNLPTKQDVIEQYETQITRFLRANGFSCESLFPRISHDALLTDDTIFNWEHLIDGGFPFIKVRVLVAVGQSPEALRLVPMQYRLPSN